MFQVILEDPIGLEEKGQVEVVLLPTEMQMAVALSILTLDLDNLQVVSGIGKQ